MFALENEFAPWRAMHKFRPRPLGGETAHVTQIGGAELDIILTGVGTGRARASALRVLEGEGEPFDVCVSSGFAGAVRSEYLVGTVLAARTIFSGEIGIGSKADRFESHSLLLALAGDCGARLADRFCTVRRSVSTCAEKKRLAASADAVEMESFEILRVAASRGVPSVALRAVSDAACEDLPFDMDQVLADGKVSIPRVLGQIVRHPRALPGLVRLGRQSKIAAESLANFLDRYVGALVSQAVSPAALAMAAVEKQIV
jgi:adenosylhomocysteine nucleosidase